MAWFHSLLTSGGGKEYTKIENVFTLSEVGYYEVDLSSLSGLNWGDFEELYLENDNIDTGEQGQMTGIWFIKLPFTHRTYHHKTDINWLAGVMQTSNRNAVDVTYKSDTEAETLFNNVQRSYFMNGTYSIYYR